ncbi:MAG: phytoene/squalene synthase family protein [Bacteroidota bacterium]
MDLYTQTSDKLSKTITRDYSTSFSLGIHMLDRKHHDSIYAIYGFVRLADEIVDTFHDQDKKTLLTRFREETELALNNKMSTNMVLHAFQDTVHRFRIDKSYIDAFLHSMEMDLDPVIYDRALYEEYIYGSAEVVGLMCLRVFCDGNDSVFNPLVEPARKLGAAFQKVNFLRDLKSDFTERGRVYFPGVDFNRFDTDVKAEIEMDIQADFDASYEGIKNLPHGSRLGVMVAYIYYLALFKKIRLLPAARIREERIRITNWHKIFLLFRTWLRYRLNLI